MIQQVDAAVECVNSADAAPPSQPPSAVIRKEPAGGDNIGDCNSAIFGDDTQSPPTDFVIELPEDEDSVIIRSVGGSNNAGSADAALESGNNAV